MTSSQSNPGFLFVLPWGLKHPGGVNQVVINLFRQLRQSGRWNPLLMVNADECPEPQYAEEEGRPEVRFRLRSPWDKNQPWIGFIKFMIRLPLVLRNLRKVLHKDQIGLVNIHYVTLSALNFTLLRMLGGFKGRRLVLSFHGTDITRASEAMGIERWLWRTLLRSADMIVTCSNALKQRVATLAPDCGHKMVVIHNGLDIDYFRAQRDQEFVLDSALDGRKYVLNVGTFLHNKGQDVLLEAFYAIAGEFPDMALVFVGASGPALISLHEQAQKFGLDERVFFYENMPHTKISAFYERAQVFCLPSRNEAFGIVLLEAGVFAVPVIASHVGGIPELIVDGEHGRLVPPADPKALAAALRDLLHNEEKAVAMGKNLQCRVETQFTWGRAARRYEQLAG